MLGCAMYSVQADGIFP